MSKRKRKSKGSHCPGCHMEFQNDGMLLSHMKKFTQCKLKIKQCVACGKEFTSDVKLFGHLNHYSSRNCRLLHNDWQKNSHKSAVMNILPQTSEHYPVHQKEPNYSAQERLGRNYLIGVGKDFLSGEIGLEALGQSDFQQKINTAFGALQPFYLNKKSSTPDSTLPKPIGENNTSAVPNDGTLS